MKKIATCIMKKGSDLIPMCELKGGQIAIVVDESPDAIKNKGKIITRSQMAGRDEPGFIIIGTKSIYSDYASDCFIYTCTLLVRVLPPGTLLKIT